MITLMAPTDLLQVPERAFAASEGMKLNLKIKRSMSGTRWCYANPREETKHDISFTGLDRNVVIQLVNFVRNNAGIKIILIDSNGLRWTGKLISYPIVTTDNSINNSDFKLSFLGKPL